MTEQTAGGFWGAQAKGVPVHDGCSCEHHSAPTQPLPSKAVGPRDVTTPDSSTNPAAATTPAVKPFPSPPPSWWADEGCRQDLETSTSPVSPSHKAGQLETPVIHHKPSLWTRGSTQRPPPWSRGTTCVREWSPRAPCWRGTPPRLCPPLASPSWRGGATLPGSGLFGLFWMRARHSLYWAPSH